jgi:signal transduction histidine kinase
MSFTAELRTPQELRHTIRQLARLVEVSVTLNSTLDIDRLLQYITETAADLLDCQAASILLYDNTENRLVFAASTGSDPVELSKIPVPLEGSLAGTIFRENQPLVINNVEEDSRHFHLVGEKVHFQTHTLLGVPMRFRERVIGVLEAINKVRGEFSSNDIRLLQVIASHAAVAIENARLVQELQSANEELRQNNKLKSDFIAIASHELRTPLSVILGYASFLKDEARDELSGHAEAVLNSAMRLHALVEDMTNLNLLQMGKAGLHLDRVPIQTILVKVYKQAHPAAEAKSQKVTLHLPREAMLVHCDPPKLELVFTNLLNNAIRFTPNEGKITIKVTPIQDKVGVEVTDTGRGIEAGVLEKIFQEFYQGEDHLTRSYSGMGLGLATARGIVELHGGRIWAESAGAGMGATFKVVLPRAGVTNQLPGGAPPG